MFETTVVQDIVGRVDLPHRLPEPPAEIEHVRRQLHIIETVVRSVEHPVLEKTFEEPEPHESFVAEIQRCRQRTPGKRKLRLLVRSDLLHLTDPGLHLAGIVLEQRLAVGKVEAEKHAVRIVRPHDAVERETEPRGDERRFAEREGHLPAHPAVGGLAAYVEDFGHRSGRVGIFGRIFEDSADQRRIQSVHWHFFGFNVSGLQK